MSILRKIYFSLRKLRQKFKFYWSVNWTKTIYFNFKKFPFESARKLPVFFYGRVRFTDLSGKIQIEVPLKRGMIGFGQPYEMNKASIGISELVLKGNLVFKGYCQFGKDYLIAIDKNANCVFGNMSSLGWKGRVVCTKSVEFGQYARLGSECQVLDSNFHDLKNTETGEVIKKQGEVKIGSYNFFSNRITVTKGTVTPNHCIVASNSVCSKDYSAFGENVMIGGIPAKLIKENITRDWKGEEEKLNMHLIIQNKYNL